MAEAVKSGRVLLERTAGSDPNAPLLKDDFSSERRKAKVLNFSIAYGKTAHGLAKDWKVCERACVRGCECACVLARVCVCVRACCGWEIWRFQCDDIVS